MQSFENARNAERISILREPVSEGGGPACADAEARRPAGAEGAGRLPTSSRSGVESTGRTFSPSRSEMAPQRLEKTESALGNGMASDASNLQHLVHARVADRGQLGSYNVASPAGGGRTSRPPREASAMAGLIPPIDVARTFG